MITKGLYGCGSLELFFFPAPFSRRESTNSSGCLTGHISIERATLDYSHQKANSNMYQMEQIFASKRVALFVRVLRPIFFSSTPLNGCVPRNFVERCPAAYRISNWAPIF